jgi:hypothetical protein
MSSIAELGHDADPETELLGSHFDAGWVDDVDLRADCERNDTMMHHFMKSTSFDDICMSKMEILPLGRGSRRLGSRFVRRSPSFRPEDVTAV